MTCMLKHIHAIIQIQILKIKMDTIRSHKNCCFVRPPRNISSELQERK